MGREKKMPCKSYSEELSQGIFALAVNVGTLPRSQADYKHLKASIEAGRAKG